MTHKRDGKERNSSCEKKQCLRVRGTLIFVQCDIAWSGRAWHYVVNMVWYGWFGMVEYVVVRYGWLSCDERPPGPQSSACVGIDSVPHCK